MSDTVSIIQHHGIVDVAMQDGSRERACMCQLSDEDVEVVEGEVSHIGVKDDDCPHRDTSVRVDGVRMGERAGRYRVDDSRRGL